METLHPGLYLQEIAGESPIEGVSTSTAAFVGVAEKGPIGESGFVTSWKNFQEIYGGYLENSYLAYAVRGFFENGGVRAYISRVVHYEGGVKKSTAAKKELTITKQQPVELESGETELQDVPVVVGLFEADNDGAWGNKIAVDIANGTEADTYTVKVFYKDVLQETFENVAKAELDAQLDASAYINYTAFDDTANLPLGRLELTGGTDGLEGLVDTDYAGDEMLHNGLHAFDNDQINLLAVPGITTVGVANAVVTYVENRGDCFAVLETPYGLKPLEARKYVLTEANIASARVAVYYSWGIVSDPIGIGKNPVKLVPPSGHVIGIYARTDNEVGVWKSPAGLKANVRGFLGVEYNVNDAEQDILNPDSINAIRVFDGEGIVVWGARTRSVTSDYRYITVRRSADYVGQSLLGGTRWAVFEVNGPDLWSKLTATGEAFLRGFWRAGGLRGTSESDAFFFNCNASTTTEDDIDAGRLFAEVGAAYQKPAEFIIFKLSLI